MVRLSGFWSYAHDDDDAESGRISQLGRDLAREYELLTGEHVDLFLDRDSLDWGSDWRREIDGSLASVAFFVPVLTPRYFKRAECRHEFRSFFDRASQLDMHGLILPVRYVELPDSVMQSTDDEVVNDALALQWVDWVSLRLSDRSSSVYRHQVNEMAQRLVQAGEAVDERLMSARALDQVGAEIALSSQDEPGLIELIADMEEAMPEWVEIIQRMARMIERLGELMSAAKVDVERSDRNGKGMAGRLYVTRKLANDLLEPAAEFSALGRKYSDSLSRVDLGMHALFGLLENSSEPELDPAAREFIVSLDSLEKATCQGLDAAESFVGEFEGIERMSRDLRRPLSLYRDGVTAMLEARQITSEWVRLASESTS